MFISRHFFVLALIISCDFGESTEDTKTNSTSENSQQSSSAAQSEDSKSPPSRKFSLEPLTEPDVAQDLEKVNYIANEIENQIKNLKQVYESMKHKLSKNRRQNDQHEQPNFGPLSDESGPMPMTPQSIGNMPYNPYQPNNSINRLSNYPTENTVFANRKKMYRKSQYPQENPNYSNMDQSEMQPVSQQAQPDQMRRMPPMTPTAYNNQQYAQMQNAMNQRGRYNQVPQSSYYPTTNPEGPEIVYHPLNPNQMQ